MPSKRRRFLKQTALGLAGVAAPAALASGADPAKTETPPGMPPAFGTGPVVGPEVTPATFAEAEKLVQVELTPAERPDGGQLARSMAPLLERRTGPRKVALEPELAPATRWNPCSRAATHRSARATASSRSPGPRRPLPARDEDIAFAPVPALSRWIETRALTSERLTRHLPRRASSASIRSSARRSR